MQDTLIPNYHFPSPDFWDSLGVTVLALHLYTHASGPIMYQLHMFCCGNHKLLEFTRRQFQS